MSNNNDNDDEEKQIVTNPKDPIYTDMSSNTNNYKLVQLNNRSFAFLKLTLVSLLGLNKSLFCSMLISCSFWFWFFIAS